LSRRCDHTVWRDLIVPTELCCWSTMRKTSSMGLKRLRTEENGIYFSFPKNGRFAPEVRTDLPPVNGQNFVGDKEDQASSHPNSAGPVILPVEPYDSYRHLKRLRFLAGVPFTNSTGKSKMARCEPRFINFGGRGILGLGQDAAPDAKRIAQRQIGRNRGGLAQESPFESPLIYHSDFRLPQQQRSSLSAPDRRTMHFSDVCCPHRFEMSSRRYTEQSGTSASACERYSRIRFLLAAF